MLAANSRASLATLGLMPIATLVCRWQVPFPMLSLQAEPPVPGDLSSSRKPAGPSRAAAGLPATWLRPGWLRSSAVAIGAFAAALLPAPLPAQDTEVVVGVSNFPPLVMEAEGSFEGFDIDIWNEVADLIGVDSTYRLMQFGDLIEALKSGEIDVAVAGISITRDRELEMDFSHPYMNSGLRILTTVDDDPGWLRLLRFLATTATLKVLGSLIAFVLLCAHILFLAERGSSDISDQYFPGILEACWCIVATITTVGYGDVAPRRWLGRFASAVVMLLGISLFGVAIAQLSAGLMMEGLRSDIAGPEDLEGRAIATVAGTTSTAVAIRLGARLHEVETIGAAHRLLEAGEVDAILFDAAPLMRYVVEDGNNTVTIVGPLIERQDYGIAFPAGSELRESVNRALLELDESGRYERIRAKWFGSSD